MMVSPSDDGNGISIRKIALGRCVKTIVLTKPIRFAIEDAKMLPILETNCAEAMMLPSWPSGRPNFLDRKKAISELGHMPLARESKKNREQSFSSVLRDAGDMLEIADFFFGGAVGGCSAGRNASVSSDSDCAGGAGAGSASHFELSSEVRPALKSPAAA